MSSTPNVRKNRTNRTQRTHQNARKSPSAPGAHAPARAKHPQVRGPHRDIERAATRHAVWLVNRVRSVRARLTGGVVPRPPRPAAEPSPTAQPEQPVPPVDHGTPGPQGTEDGVGRWQRFQEVAVPLARRGAAATVQLASVVMAAFVAAFVWSRARVSRLAARRAERKAARATGVETGNSAAPRARWTGWTWIGESVFRLCWWGALALFAVGGQTLFAVRGGDPIAAALPLFVAGFALCALVLLIAPHARRLRWGAFALGAGHGALALLAAIVSWTQIY